MYAVVIDFSVQYTDSFMHLNVCVCMCIYILFQNLFYKLLQNIECSSLCYTVGSCWLFILYI